MRLVPSQRPGRAIICRDDTDNLPVNREGRIQCATCHDIHQNAQNPKLLRTPRWDSSLCIDCHGIEALWRFLYYHKENRNPNPGHSAFRSLLSELSIYG